MESIEATKQTLSNIRAAAGVLQQVIPGRLAALAFGMFGAGLGIGILAGVVGTRLLHARHHHEHEFDANYEAWTKAKLYDLASEREIAGRSEMSKSELIGALRAA